jgi:hypothetical protein
MATGPSGWTRTTTTRVKSPACCLDTTEGMEPPRGIEPRPRPYQGRMLPLSPWRRGASGRIRTGRHRVGGPRSCRWTTLALVRPTGIEPVPPRWQRGMRPPHPGRTWTGVVHRSTTVISCQRPRSRRAPLVPPVFGGSARIRTRTRELWRLGCSRYTTLPMSAHVSKTHPPCALTWPLRRGSDQNKKGLPGDRPRRPLTP